MKKILKNNNGFSLLELIITLAILSIIIIPISSLFINSAKATNSANDKLIALSIAQGEMERIKLQDDLEDEIKENDKLKTHDEYNEFLYEVNIIKDSKEDEEKEKNTEVNNIQTENKKQISQEIEINSSKLKEDDYYILIIDKIGVNYTLTTQFKNSEITQTVDLESTQKQKETISILIKDNNTVISKEHPVKIEVSNQSIKPLEIYIEKENNISILNKLGDIRIYKNYNSKKTISHLYNINIKVYKDNSKKELIEEIESYKNIVQ